MSTAVELHQIDSLNPTISNLQLGQLLQKKINKHTFAVFDEISQGKSNLSISKISKVLLMHIDYAVDDTVLCNFLLNYFNLSTKNQLCNWKRILTSLLSSPTPQKRPEIEEYLPKEIKPFVAQILKDCKKWDLDMSGKIQLNKFKDIVAKKCQIDLNDGEFMKFAKHYANSLDLNSRTVNYNELFSQLGFTRKISSSEQKNEMKIIERKFRDMLSKRYDLLARTFLASDRYAKIFVKKISQADIRTRINIKCSESV